MPGPISDSYDPVWGTSSNADEVLTALRDLRQQISDYLGVPPRYILDVIRESDFELQPVVFSIRQLRMLRFALSVALSEEEI